MPKLLPSEYERDGPHPFGGIGLSSAEEKARYMKRTGQDPTVGADLDADPNDWNTGGLRDPNDKL